MTKTDFSKLIKISLIVLLIFLIAALVIVFVSSINKDKKKSIVTFNEDYTLLQPLMLPDEPSLPDDYYLVRPRNYEWTQEDVDSWFSIPNSKLLDELHQANNSMINDLLEAAP